VTIPELLERVAQKSVEQPQTPESSEP